MQDLDDLAKSDLDRLEKLADNLKWVDSHYDSLKRQFNRQYVAIQEMKILDYDSDLESLIKRLNIINYNKSIAIEYINN